MSVSMMGLLTASGALFAAMALGIVPQTGITQEVFFGGVASCASALIMILSSLEA